MIKILITGGSGFIGTNLIEYLMRHGTFEIRNVDIAAPRLSSHRCYWQNVDICDRAALLRSVSAFSPEYVVHLAARTDLDGACLSDYAANVSGVSNLLDALESVPCLKRAVFASSMYVCEPGYIPDGPDDYAPHTVYGASKVETERRVKARSPRYAWCIIRPTSIWGPWFGEPYNRFFRMVLNHMYFHMGRRACRKTYGYVGNAVYQVQSLLTADEAMVHGNVFYLGDYAPYDISEWADEIASYAGIRIPRLPYAFFKVAGWFGDFLKQFGIGFPMTSFRLHNMTTDNIHDLTPIREIAPCLPFQRQAGTRLTLEWIRAERMQLDLGGVNRRPNRRPSLAVACPHSPERRRHAA